MLSRRALLWGSTVSALAVATPAVADCLTPAKIEPPAGLNLTPPRDVLAQLWHRTGEALMRYRAPYSTRHRRVLVRSDVQELAQSLKAQGLLYDFNVVSDAENNPPDIVELDGCRVSVHVKKRLGPVFYSIDRTLIGDELSGGMFHHDPWA